MSSCAFDPSGNLFALIGPGGIIDKFVPANPTPTVVVTASPYGIWNDLVMEDDGNLLVSDSDLGDRSFKEYDLSGTLLASHALSDHYGPSGPDGLAVAAGSATAYYTSLGPTLRSYDLDSDSYSGDVATFATTLDRVRMIGGGPFSGQLLVSRGTEIDQLTISGTEVYTYDISGQSDSWDAIYPDPTDSNLFWAVDAAPYVIAEYTLGQQSPTSVINLDIYDLGGLCVMPGDRPTATPTASPTATATSTPIPTVTCAAHSEWCTDLSPNAGTGANELRGVVAVSNSDVWAVGGSDIVDQDGLPLVEHWDGSTWAPVSPVPTVGILNGVAALSDTDAWAVSDSNVIHWNGTDWETADAPNGAKAISAVLVTTTPTTDDIWAVGAVNIEHYDGSTWAISTAVPSGGVLNAVAAISQTEVWAVGSLGSDPLVMHYAGSWATVAVPTPASATAVTLYGVDAYSASSLWVAGAYYSDRYWHTLVEYYDGTGQDGWRIVPSPNLSTSENELYKIYVTFPGDVWAVGAFGESGTDSPSTPGFVYPGLEPLLLHWNGQSWDQIDSPAPGVGTQLLAVTGATSLSPEGKLISSDWAVGSFINTSLSSSQTLIEHITPPAYPVRTTSYYELTTSTAIHYQQGCAAATGGDNNSPSGLIFLDYGQPRDWSITTQHDWGTWLIPHGEPDASRKAKIADIQAAVESFIDGYGSCVSSGSPQVHIAVSVNDDVSLGATVNAGHAQAWAGMVKAIKVYAAADPWVFVSAGIDAEPQFDPGCKGSGWCGDSESSNTENWMRAYSDTLVSNVFDFGSLDGYPCRPADDPGFPPPRSCIHDWNQERDFQVASGITGARPAPQIYIPGWARDWYIVKRWGMEDHPDKPALEFKGLMTGCDGLMCTPVPPPDGSGLDYRQAWPILWLEVNSDPARGLYPYWPTYIEDSSP